MAEGLRRPDVVLHISTVHQLRDIRIFHKQVVPLAQQGYLVEVAAPAEELHDSPNIKEISLGKPGGRRWRRIGRNLRAVWIMARKRYAAIHIHAPDLLVGAVVPLLLGAHVMYDVHEFYRVRFKESDWIWPPLRHVMAAVYSTLERLVLPHCAGIIVVTEEMRVQYSRYEPRTPVVLVRNYPFITDNDRRQARLGGPPLPGPYIVHTGGASRLKAFDVLVAVAERLAASGSNTVIVNLGPIDLSAFPHDERERLLERANQANVVLPGNVPYEDLLRWIAHARIGYILYQDNQTYAIGIPTKLFEYFAFGLPVVATQVGQTAELVRDSSAGLLVSASTVDEHVGAITRLLQDDDLARRMSDAAYTWARRFDYEPELRRLLELYDEVTRHSAHRGLEAALRRDYRAR